MKKESTIQNAVHSLPNRLGQRIQELWDASQIMDIYDGCLTTYIVVMTKRFRSLHDRIAFLENKLEQIKTNASLT